MIYTQTQLDDAFNVLPKKLQDFIMSPEVSDALNLMEEEYEIPEEKVDEFALSIFTLLSGLGNSEGLLYELQSKFGLEEDRAQTLVLDVYDVLVEPASYLLNKIERENSEDTTDNKIEKLPSQQQILHGIEKPFSISQPQSALPRTITPLVSSSLAKLSSNTSTTPPLTNLQPTAPSILDSKLTTPTSLPKEEINISNEHTVQEDSEVHPQNQNMSYKSADPYREPFE